MQRYAYIPGLCAKMALFVPSFWAILLMGSHSLFAVPKPCRDVFLELSGVYQVSMNFFAKDNHLSAADRTAVEQEARAAWEFLREYHAAVGGNANVPFGIHGVEIRPINEAPGHREFSVQDGKIIIGLRRNLLGYFRTHTPQDIRDRWERGDQYPAPSLFHSNPMSKVWPFVNPSGGFRQGLRATVKDLQGSAAERLFAATIGELKEIAKGKLEGKSDSEIEGIRERWIRSARDESTLEGVVNAATRRIIQDQMPNYELNLSSYGVNVGNLHDIQIGIRTGEDVIPPAERPTVRVNSHGALVNVFTIDRIHIELNLAGAVERLSLARALANTGN